MAPDDDLAVMKPRIHPRGAGPNPPGDDVK
jgi:hypothetical protein